MCRVMRLHSDIVALKVTLESSRCSSSRLGSPQALSGRRAPELHCGRAHPSRPIEGRVLGYALGALP